MKRLTSMILLISVFVCMVCTPLVVDAVSTSDEVVNVKGHNFGSAINATSVSQWGNYAFVTSGKSLKVLDLQTDSVVMTWDVRAQLSAASGNLIQSYITDDYIVCISNSDILVFENSKRVTDPLNFLMTIKPEGEDSFAQIKKFAVIDDKAYVFYHKDGEVFIAEFDADFENIEAVDNVATILSEDIHDIGCYEIIWDSVLIEDAVYFVSLDDNEIFTTLYAHKVDLDTFEKKTTDIISKKESSFCVDFTSTEEIDENVLCEMRLVVNGILQVPTVKDLIYSPSPIINIVARPSEEGYVATFSLTELGESAFTEAYGSIENVSLSYYGEDYEFGLTEVDYGFSYNRGTLVLYKSSLMVLPEDPLVYNDISTLYAYTINDNNFTMLGKTMLNTLPPRNTMIRNVKIVGDEMVFFYKDSNLIGVAEFNPDRISDINYTFKTTFLSNDASYMVASSFSDYVKIGNRLYYPSNTSTSLGYIEVKDFDYFTDYAYDRENNVLMVYGNAKSDIVTVTIDKKSYNVTPVGGAWRLNVPMLKAGSHRVKVNSDKSDTFTVVTDDFESPIVISDAVVDENGLTLSVTNNTNIYSLNTANINLYAIIYDGDGRAVCSAVTSVNNIAAGSSDVAVFDSLTDDFLASYPEYSIKVYPYGQNRNPLSNPYQIDNGLNTEIVVQEELIGRVVRVNDLAVSVNPVTMKAEITGVLEATAPRTVWLNVSVGGTTKDIVIAHCDEDGNFKAEFDFTNEVISENGADYIFALSAIGMNSQDAVTYKLYSADAFDAITDAISGIADYVELSTILDDSTPVKRVYRESLGIDFSDETFAGFDETVKAEILNKIIEEIKDGKIKSDTFEDLCFEKKDALDVEEALNLLNTVTANKLTQVLVKYHDALEISKKVWSSYSKYIDSAKAVAINKEIIKKREFDNGKDIEDAIKFGISEYLKKNSEEKESLGGGGGGGGGFIIAPPEQTPVLPIEPINPPSVNTDKTFVDLEGFEWAMDAIEELQEKNIINGMDEEHFEPAGIVTRAQFVKMLVLAFDFNNDAAVSEFADVNIDDWFYPYVAVADQIGLTKGDGTNFYPNRTLTREEMAVLAYRALEISEIEIPETVEKVEFSDAETFSEYATEGIAAMQRAGIINGMGDNIFAPKTMCNRAMAAKVISSLLGLE